MNNRDMGKKSGVKMMADGGSVGFFDRLRMGNIDQEGSRAYNELGAGKQAIDRAYADTSRKMDVQPSEAAMPVPVKESKVMPTEKDYGITGGSGMDEKDARDDAIGNLPSIARVVDSPAPAEKPKETKARPAASPKTRSPLAAPNTSYGAGIANGYNAMESARMDRTKSRAMETPAPALAKKPAPKSMVTDVGLPDSSVIAPGKSYFNDNGSVKTDAPEPPMRNAKTGKPYANGGMMKYANGGMVAYAHGGMVCNSRDMGK